MRVSRVTQGLLVAPLVPVILCLLFGFNSSLVTVIMIFGPVAAYTCALLLGLPILHLLKKMKLVDWPYLVLGGAVAACPIIAFYYRGAPTHLELYGARVSLLFCLLGAIAGLVFWRIAMKQNNDFSSLPNSLVPGILVLAIVSLTGVYIEVKSTTSEFKGTILPQPGDVVENSRRNIVIDLDNGLKLSGYLPAYAPLLTACKIYGLSRGDYFSSRELYWVLGYESRLRYEYNSLGVKVPSCND